MVEAELGGVAVIDHARARALHAAGLGVDQEQGQPGLRVAFTVAARDDDEAASDMSIDHEGLAAIEHKTSAASFGTGCDITRRVAWRFVEGERNQEFAGGDGRQKFSLLCDVAGGQQQRCGEHGARGQRRGSERTPGRLHDLAHALVAEAGPAVHLGDQDAGPA